MADLVTVMHDIDAMRGKVCGRCVFWASSRRGGGRTCRKGYMPADETDGCDDWQPRPHTDREVQALARVVMSL